MWKGGIRGDSEYSSLTGDRKKGLLIRLWARTGLGIASPNLWKYTGGMKHPDGA